MLLTRTEPQPRPLMALFQTRDPASPSCTTVLPLRKARSSGPWVPRLPTIVPATCTAAPRTLRLRTAASHSLMGLGTAPSGSHTEALPSTTTNMGTATPTSKALLASAHQRPRCLRSRLFETSRQGGTRALKTRRTTLSRAPVFRKISDFLCRAGVFFSLAKMLTLLHTDTLSDGLFLSSSFGV